MIFKYVWPIWSNFKSVKWTNSFICMYLTIEPWVAGVHLDWRNSWPWPGVTGSLSENILIKNHNCIHINIILIHLFKVIIIELINKVIPFNLNYYKNISFNGMEWKLKILHLLFNLKVLEESHSYLKAPY